MYELFFQIEAYLSLKMCGYRQFSFCISKTFFSHIVINRANKVLQHNCKTQLMECDTLELSCYCVNS